MLDANLMSKRRGANGKCGLRDVAKLVVMREPWHWALWGERVCLFSGCLKHKNPTGIRCSHLFPVGFLIVPEGELHLNPQEVLNLKMID